jgi:hypothetical protein
MTRALDMTEVERAALAAFAKQYGHQWKAYLKAAWLSYRHNGIHMGGKDTGTLREIRNDRGMRWLEKVRTADLQPAPASAPTGLESLRHAEYVVARFHEAAVKQQPDSEGTRELAICLRTLRGLIKIGDKLPAEESAR